IFIRCFIIRCPIIRCSIIRLCIIRRFGGRMFKGSYVALVTPMRKGRLDEAALRSLVDYHVEHHSDGLVPCGSTGESATLSHEEHGRVVEVVVKAARGRIPVIAGAGSNS